MPVLDSKPNKIPGAAAEFIYMESGATYNATTDQIAATVVDPVENLSELRTIDGVAGQVVYIAGRTTAGDGGDGHFRWVTGDQSANVAADTESIIWVAGTDGTGVGGAWNKIPQGRIIVGGKTVSGAGLRDGINVAQTITGTTNTHAFADKSEISAVTDSGTYGSFDNTVKISGSHAHNHVYGFQDRTDYQGSGTLSDMSGLYSAPTHSGSGTITQRVGAEVRDVTKTGGGTLVGNIGVFIRNLAAGVSNVALNIAQITGYAIYAPGDAKSYLKGQLGIGVDNTGNNAIQFSNSQTGGSTTTGILDTQSTSVVLSASGDKNLIFANNGANRLVVKTSANSYAVAPGSDNAQPLGTVAERWLNTYSVNIRPGAGSAIWTSGTGSPEGAVTAVVGSMYTRTDGGAGSTLYIKESGSGNTGWVAK